MLFYKIYVNTQEEVDLKEYVTGQIQFDEQTQKKNLLLEINHRIDKLEKPEACLFYVISVQKREAEVILQIPYEHVQDGKHVQLTNRLLAEFWKTDWISVPIEITVKEFKSKLSDAISYQDAIEGSLRVLNRKYGWDYFDNCNFEMKETIGSDQEDFSKEIGLRRVREMMGDVSLSDEICRIYHPDNPKTFLGHPVHYRIRSGVENADEIAGLLVDALYHQGRVCSKRINKVSRITDLCYDENELECMIKNAIGGTVLLDMSGKEDRDDRHASVYQSVIDYLAKLACRYGEQVLFLFVENSRQPGFSGKLISQISDKLDLVDICDGRGDREEAKQYFERIWMNSSLGKFDLPELDEILFEEKEYLATEVQDLFQKCSTEYLRKNIYKAYQQCRVIRDDMPVSGRSYGALSELIGLSQVKEMTKQIVADAVISDHRKRLAGAKYASSKHMLFTGNPGSCKTTVARILARTLREEGVLETGAFVECGRADLTAKYVGWTDKQVRNRFRQAKGGILFIDEAYSLVEEGGYYGDEAINTIVQEMENYREQVIVIFAGYPDKMESFLAKNEGLRSRIAFHVQFPDYTVDELGDILRKMLKEKHFTASPSAYQRASEIFAQAVAIPEFGNGRFVRNMLEQALMKQSVRLYEKYRGGEIPKRELFSLRAEDFELPGLIQETSKRAAFGFR